MMGASLESLGAKELPDTGFYAVKESVFPFSKFPGVDVVLGPEMRSTGEVMGADRSLPVAFAKAQMAAGVHLPTEGQVFLSVREADKQQAVEVARSLASMGFTVLCSDGTARTLKQFSVACTVVPKIASGQRPNVLDLMANGQVQLVINTPTKKGGSTDEGRIRAQAVRGNVPIITTIAGARAAMQAIQALRSGNWQVFAMQDYFPALARARAEVPVTV
jgi:carbamoyl-phosphate synthase large subunit